MPVYLTSLSEMVTMPIAVNTEEYIDVWCNTATDTSWKIRVGDVIAVKWNADENDREYTWCTVLAARHTQSHSTLTLLHEQGVDVPGHPDGEATHVTYNWTVYTSGYQNKWVVYNFDNAAEHAERVIAFVNEVEHGVTSTLDDCWDESGVRDHLTIANLSGVPGDFDDNEGDNQAFIINDDENASHVYTDQEWTSMYGGNVDEWYGGWY